MALPTFQQWLMERGKRTSLGIYPPLYGSGQRPPLDFAPSSAGHLNAFASIHGDEHPELLSKEIRDQYKNNKKRGLIPYKKPKDKLKSLGL
jgi:hypothetical protein